MSVSTGEGRHERRESRAVSLVERVERSAVRGSGSDRTRTGPGQPGPEVIVYLEERPLQEQILVVELGVVHIHQVSVSPSRLWLSDKMVRARADDGKHRNARSDNQASSQERSRTPKQGKDGKQQATGDRKTVDDDPRTRQIERISDRNREDGVEDQHLQLKRLKIWELKKFLT